MTAVVLLVLFAKNVPYGVEDSVAQFSYLFQAHPGLGGTRSSPAGTGQGPETQWVSNACSISY